MATVELEIDLSDIADRIDLRELASELNYDDLRDSISYSELGENVDVDALAGILILNIQRSDFLMESLAEKIAAKINTAEKESFKLRVINAISQIY